jgi:hypothetical protein
MKTTLQEMDYCADCHRQTLHVSVHTQERCSHLLHFVLSIFTGGLWILIWVLALVCCEDSTTDPACTVCGSTDTHKPWVMPRWVTPRWLKLSWWLS